MYAINPISRNTLITPDECTVKLPNSSLDSKKWIAAIELAEVRFVMPLLGWNLYNAICAEKNIIVDAGNLSALQAIFTAQFGTDPTTGDPNVTLVVGNIVNSIDLGTVSAANRNLWNQALWNYVFNCVWFIAFTENYAQFSSSGLQKNNPLDSAIGSDHAASVGISLNDLKYLSDRILLDRINPLQDYVEQWLCVNRASYPLYPYANCEDRETTDGQYGKRRTSTFINIYEDDDEDECWRNRNNYPVPTPSPTPTPVTSTCSMVLQIVTTPDGTLFLLCNLQTMPAQYAASATTLTLSNLVNKYVNASGAFYNGNPVTIGPTNTGLVIGYNQATGTFDRTLQGGFNDGDTFSFLYTETM